LPRTPIDPNDELWRKATAADTLGPVAPGEVGFTLWVEEGRGTTLVAKSAETEPFVYMAMMVARRDGKLMASPTTICAVQPGHAGVEVWPYPLEAIQIVGMGVSPPDMCYDLRAKKGYKMGEQPPSAAQQ
jgi:hypothetical protein